MASTAELQGGNPERHESRVLIINTGGTIVMQQTPSGYVPSKGFQTRCLEPRSEFNDRSGDLMPIEVVIENGIRFPMTCLRTPPSTYSKSIRYGVYEFADLQDSSSIGIEGWTQVAETIHRNYDRFDGFVILHGTDSLAYTASALSFMLQNLGKPVILTGSQTPMIELQNDGVENLLGALIIAGHFMIPEVCLFFNRKLLRGNRSTKVSATDFDAFSSPNCLPLGMTSSVRTSISWPLVYRSKSLHAFSIQTKFESAVACLRIFPGIVPEMVDGVLKLEGLRGLILETFGAGNVPGGTDGKLTKAIADAILRGVVVVSVTQCLTGNVRPAYASATSLGQVGVIFGHDMTSEAALTKLCYLLGQSLPTEEIARQMSSSLRGELTDSSTVHFEDPASADLSPEQEKISALGYAISHGNLEKVELMLKGEPDLILDTPDYMGNTSVHLAACTDDRSILSYILSRGASVHLRNKSGKTPLSLATDNGLTSNVELLRQAGAHLHASERDRITA